MQRQTFIARRFKLLLQNIHWTCTIFPQYILLKIWKYSKMVAKMNLVLSRLNHVSCVALSAWLNCSKIVLVWPTVKKSFNQNRSKTVFLHLVASKHNHRQSRCCTLQWHQHDCCCNYFRLIAKGDWAYQLWISRPGSQRTSFFKSINA